MVLWKWAPVLRIEPGMFVAPAISRAACAAGRPSAVSIAETRPPSQAIETFAIPDLGEEN